MAEVQEVVTDGNDDEFGGKVAAYVERGMNGCLECETDNDSIQVSDSDMSDDGAYVEVRYECAACGTEWVTEYQLVGIRGRKIATLN